MAARVACNVQGPALLEAPPRAWPRNACFGQLCNEGAELRCGVTLSHVTRSGASTGGRKIGRATVGKGQGFLGGGACAGQSLGSTRYRPQVWACSAGRERGGSSVGSLVPLLPDARRCPSPSVAAAVVDKRTPRRGQSRTPGGWDSTGPLSTRPGWPRPSLGLAPSLLHPPPFSMVAPTFQAAAALL